MGRLCFPDQLDSSARPGPHVNWQILSQDLCGLFCCKYTHVGHLTNLRQIYIHKSFPFNKDHFYFWQVYCIGTILSMQISFVGFQPVQSSEHMAVSMENQGFFIKKKSFFNVCTILALFKLEFLLKLKLVMVNCCYFAFAGPGSFWTLPDACFHWLREIQAECWTV